MQNARDKDNSDVASGGDILKSLYWLVVFIYQRDVIMITVAFFEKSQQKKKCVRRALGQLCWTVLQTKFGSSKRLKEDISVPLCVATQSTQV